MGIFEAASQTVFMRHRRAGVWTPPAVLAGLLVALMVVGLGCHGRVSARSGGLMPAVASLTGPFVAEEAQLLPVYTTWQDSDRLYRLPGVQSTRRVTYDSQSGRVQRIELALAEPLVVYTAATGEEGQEKHPPRVALTFDDGPSSAYTPQILKILRDNGVNATFFVLGCCAVGQQGLVKQASEEGNEIGIHTWNHPQLTKMSDAAIHADLARCQKLLDPLVKEPVRWVRPPYGDRNKRVDAAIASSGYREILWDIDTRDWTKPGASVIARRVLSQARDGSVVLMHDGGGGRDGTVAAVRTIVPTLLARGFQMVTLSQLKGIAPGPPTERGMVLTVGNETFSIEDGLDDVRVFVDGNEVPLTTPPMKTKGQFLLHGRPVLSALGAACTWHGDSLTLEVDATRGHFLVRLNSQSLVVNGKEVFVQVPAVFYHGQALLPVWLIANACGATVSYDETTRSVRFVSGSAIDTGLAPDHSRPLIAQRGLDGMAVYGGPYEVWTL